MTDEPLRTSELHALAAALGIDPGRLSVRLRTSEVLVRLTPAQARDLTVRHDREDHP